MSRICSPWGFGVSDFKVKQAPSPSTLIGLQYEKSKGFNLKSSKASFLVDEIGEIAIVA